MEDWLIAFLVLACISIISVTIIYLSKFSGGKRKKAIKTVEAENIDTITKSYENSMEILKYQNEFLMADSKQTKKRLAAEVGINLRQNESISKTPGIKIDVKNLQQEYVIDVDSGVKLVESMNLPLLDNMDKSKIPNLLKLPMVKKKVWEYIENNVDEMISLGVIVPKGQTTEQEKSVEQSENGMMNLEFSENNAKFMA